MSDTVQIHSIAITRLFNLGDYEHVKYEVRVEIAPTNEPEPVTAGQIFERLDRLMLELDPRPPCSQRVVQDAEEWQKLNDQQKSTEAEEQGNEGSIQIGDYIKRKDDEVAEIQREMAKFNERRRLAFEALDKRGFVVVGSDPSNATPTEAR